MISIFIPLKFCAFVKVKLALPNVKILDWSKLKALIFAKENLNGAKMTKFLLGLIENRV